MMIVSGNDATRTSSVEMAAEMIAVSAKNKRRKFQLNASIAQRLVTPTGLHLELDLVKLHVRKKRLYKDDTPKIERPGLSATVSSLSVPYLTPKNIAIGMKQPVLTMMIQGIAMASLCSRRLMGIRGSV